MTEPTPPAQTNPLAKLILRPANALLPVMLACVSLPLALLTMLAANNAALAVGLRLTQSKSLLLAALAAGGLGLLCLLPLWPQARAWMGRTLAGLRARLGSRAGRLGTLARAGVWLALALLPVAHSYFFLQSSLGRLLAESLPARLYMAWLLTLLGAALLALANGWKPRNALLAALLFNALAWQVLAALAEVSATPFAQGWSEGSRLYQAALFNSRALFGAALPLPTLNPTLHALLSVPFFLGAPIWLHRLWRVGLLLGLAGAAGWALARRYRLAARLGGWAALTVAGVAAAAVLALPVYLHLLVPFILVVLFVRAGRPWQAGLALLLASVWAGLSRFNWYPVPAMFAVVLWAMGLRRRLTFKDIALALAAGLLGTALAFGSARAYMAVAGTSARDFFLIITQSLLFARLLPSETYPLGVLPGTLLFSLPFWALFAMRWGRPGARPVWLRGWGLLLVGGVLLALLGGGLLVSTKIGGGGDIHNLDAYGLMLLLLSAEALFGPAGLPGENAAGAATAEEDVAAEDGVSAGRAGVPWGLAFGALLVLVFFAAQKLPNPTTPAPDRWQATLQGVQAYADKARAAGKPALFISQRQLLALGAITGVQVLPEYDREDLMDRAMAGDAAYLKQLEQRLAAHEFGMIVVDELVFTYKGTADAMGQEHNAWSKWVIRPILCHYQLAALYSEDKLAVYTPRDGAPQCPTLPGR